MKNLVVLILLTFSISFIFAQDNLQKTKIEEAVFTNSSLFKQEVFSLDNVPEFRIDALKVTNLEKFSSTSGLRIVHKIQTGKELKTFYNYIDTEEIDGLITSLQYMKIILKSKTVPGNYTEVKFTTKSGFQIMLFTVLNVQNKLDWSFQVLTNISNEKSLVALSNDAIDKLQKMMEQAKAKL